jgi:hypothetical protein
MREWSRYVCQGPDFITAFSGVESAGDQTAHLDVLGEIQWLDHLEFLGWGQGSAGAALSGDDK